MLRVRLVLLGSLLLLGCSEAPPSAPQPIGSQPEFVGSQTCEACHSAQYSDWQGSHHELAMQVADADTVLGDFSNTTVRYFDTESQFLQKDGAFIVRTENADGELEEFRVTHTFGIYPLQQYLVEFPNGRMQALPFAWDTRGEDEGGQRWFHLYPDEYIGPGDELHWIGRSQNWNYMCAECHSTDIDLNYDLESDAFATTWSEIDVGCEACHGPASRHVSQATLGSLGSDADLLVNLDDSEGAVWQMNLQTGIAERSRLAMRPPQQPESCGRCHARRGIITEVYEYGQPLAQTHRPALLHEPLYFADGQIRDEVYVYGSFLQSRMYTAGVSCSNCHNPHSLQLVTGNDPNDVCSQCHLPARFASQEHSKHELDQAGCVDCHMPARIYMGVDARRDHSFRLPQPHLSQGTDIPNACNACHEDESAAWASARYIDWWGNPQDKDARPLSGIMRATLLSSLTAPLSPQEADAVTAGLRDADPLVRIASLQALRGLAAETRLQLAPALLADPVRGVRLQAALVLAPLRGYLPQASQAAFAAAANEYRAAQRAVASRPESHAALAEFEASLGNAEQALAHSERALAMAPKLAVLRHAHGLLLVRSGRAEEGLQELAEAARLEPGVARFTYVYAVALNSLGQPDAALQTLHEALQRFPMDFDIAWALATMLRDQGEVARATAIARDLARQYPDNPNIKALLQSLAAH